MRLIIFAGGIGTRLWPLSRRAAPKQFDKIFNGQSTLELAVERVSPTFGYENIFIQTTREYSRTIRKIIPGLPKKNIILEPARRNLAPAVCLAALKFKREGYHGPVAILWADHLMEHVAEFTSALTTAEKLILNNPERFIFMAERPRFPNNNLGWLKVGNKLGMAGETAYYGFQGWQYKPDEAKCEAMFRSGEYYWNPGYFITAIDFLIGKYQALSPVIFNAVDSGNYESAPAESFDRAIIEKINHNEAVVLKTNFGWSDPGTLYALKEALARSEDENVTAGLVKSLNTRDCLIYNLESKKLVTAVGLDGYIIINAKDALLVVKKEKVKEVTDLVKKLEAEGLAKYL